MRYKSLLILLVIFFIIICIVSLNIMDLQAQKRQVLKENLEYEQYLNKEILGTELATLIGKVVDQNEKNEIQKDNKGYYINNNINSIKIDLKMTTINKTYPMEEMYNSKISNFVQNFNLIKFKCTKIEYHKKSSKISKLVFEELQ